MDFSLALKLYTAEQVKTGEVTAAQMAGVPMYSLMQRAGMAVYERFQRIYPRAKHVLVVCGKGNNGGDGYVFATLAMQAQLKVNVYQLGDPVSLQGDARQAYLDWRAQGGELRDWGEWRNDLFEADVVIDAMLGTGLTGEVRDEFRRRIEQINDNYSPVIAIDIPSGLSADTGAALGCAIKAAHTVTFIGVKQGLCTGSGRNHVGELHFCGLGVDKEFESLSQESALGIDHKIIPRLWPKTEACAHKGDHGRLVCVGGNQGMAGAIRLCSTAAARAGAGLVAAITHPDSVLPLQTGCPEVMSAAVSAQSLSERDNALARRIQWADILVYGPGFGVDEWAYCAYQQLSGEAKVKVVDADGLNMLAAQHKPAPDQQRIITPHPGEAARLLGVSVAEIEQDRFAAARRLQQEYGGVVVLKGAGTLIYDGQRMYVCLAGNPGMASGGMGDVLSGVLGAMLARGLSLAIAARLAVVIHSHAADLNVTKFGTVGLLASDVIDELRTAINQRVK
ncbi:NAD(P)H-hydrate dehydratase [Vibrio sp. CAU 1672]|uniref:NAD(P)H-hydrate dehydratase n=1 Tax=Vibrio sp. CAU 1672 TaxID=3032594 RepID=UPI0023DB687F|nr:NAD(P)H-hydrate dehydratase [Vibrio sp. CAU 1672]MDF2155309.1 NAD(P)H-hydrate dehydratase [Vibrio sp. CAU 1672]